MTGEKIRTRNVKNIYESKRPRSLVRSGLVLHYRNSRIHPIFYYFHAGGKSARMATEGVMVIVVQIFIFHHVVIY